MAIQSAYNRHQQRGLVGTLAKPNAPYEYDDGAKIGVEVTPGDAVLYDRANNEFIKPTTAAQELQVTHIVTFDPSIVVSNTGAFASGSNSDAPVTYPADSIIKPASLGSFFVVAGATVKKYDQALYQLDDGKWDRYDPSAPTLANGFAVTRFEFLDDAVDGDIVPVRIVGRVASDVNLEAIQDAIGAYVVAGTGITSTYNDTTGETTIAADNLEAIQDAIGSSVIGGTGIDVTYDDGTGETTVATSA